MFKKVFFNKRYTPIETSIPLIEQMAQNNNSRISGKNIQAFSPELLTPLHPRQNAQAETAPIQDHTYQIRYNS